MNEYARITRQLRRHLEPVDRAREDALRLARSTVRSCSALIRGLHRGRWDATLARRLDADRKRLGRLLEERPQFAGHGAVLQAQGEVAEAFLLRAFLDHEPPSDPDSLRVPPEAYLLGLGDLVGELRRVTLGRLLADDVEGAHAAFDSMEKAYEALLDANLPDGAMPLRQKIDAARGTVERTRGDLVTAKKAKQLEKKIDGIGRLLDEAETPPAKRRANKADDDLDVDAAWGKH